MEIKTKIGLIDFVMECMALLIILRGTFGIVMYIPGYSANIYFFIYFIWFIIAILKKATFIGMVLKRGYWILIFLFINIVFDLLFNGTVTTIIKNYIILFILYSIYLYYKNGYKTFKMVVLFALFCDVMIVMVNTLKEMVINPYISRQLATANGVANFEGNSNMLVSFQFIYAGVCLVVYLIPSVREYSKKIQLFQIFFIILFITVLLKASYFFSILITLMCFSIYFLPENKLKKYYFLFSLILGMPLLKGELSTMLNNISTLNFINDVLYGKIRDLSNLLGSGEGGASQSELRFELYLKSLKTFSENIFLGVHSTWKNNYIIGGHSGWFDGFAQFGILRFTPFLLFIRNTYKYLLNDINKNLRRSVSTSFIAFIIIGIINPHIFSQMWLVLYIVIPFLATINKDI